MSGTLTEEQAIAIRDKVFQILEPIANTDHYEVLFDSDAVLNYWIKAFTHESVDPVNNYQSLEFFGDVIMNYSFAEYIRKLALQRDYQLSQSKASIVLNYYMSKPQQAKMARDLGLVEYVRFDTEHPDINISVQEDVLEAFFGALNILCNDKIEDGLGPIYCFNLIANLYNQIDIDFEKIQKDAVSQLKELYEKMGWGNKPNYVISPSDQPQRGRVKVVVTTNQGDALGIGYGSSKKTATPEAAEQALKTLESMGVTAESADREKVERRLKHDPEFELQYRRVEMAIKKINELARKQRKLQGTEFKIRQLESHQSGNVSRTTFAIEVAYPKPDGTIMWRRLDSLTGPDKEQTKINLMKKYADNLGIPARI